MLAWNLLDRLASLPGPVQRRLRKAPPGVARICSDSIARHVAAGLLLPQNRGDAGAGVDEAEALALAGMSRIGGGRFRPVQLGFAHPATACRSVCHHGGPAARPASAWTASS